MESYKNALNGVKCWALIAFCGKLHKIQLETETGTEMKNRQERRKNEDR